ncbi:TPA: hypothetical protein EYP44_00185 [Candidatus Bathyarchaeota archaeon]|nr:hypothetical protein [Candidatus Bathyarchaeota archaeon]
MEVKEVSERKTSTRCQDAARKTRRAPEGSSGV